VPQHFHAVVWIDHREAHVFGFGTGGIDAHTIHAPDEPGHIHHRAGPPKGGHAHADRSFLAEVAAALGGYQEILIAGPAQTRTELAAHIREHVPALAPHVLGVEALDRKTEGEIVAFARKFFERKDLSTPQR